MKLEGQVAIVTGAGRNIGEEIAKLFAAEGARVAVVDLDGGRGDAVAAAIGAGGGEAASFVADVSNSDDVQGLIAAVVERFGRIDILVNNVAISDNRDVLEITEEEWDRTIAVTLTAPFLMAKYAALRMVEQGSGGKIVNIGSTSGHRGRASAVAYSAAKGGVANLTRSLAYQLAPHGIRVNTVSPNKTGSAVGQQDVDPNRPVTNLAGRPGVPADTARAVLFLVSDDSDFIIGQNLFADGGVTAMEVG
jgi:NAD(P)-dependent dehydrogenase (short-subunit alcohol dehydrogenase family)